MTAAGPELGLANVGGVFVVLIGGMFGACIVGILEFIWNTRQVAVDERVRNKNYYGFHAEVCIRLGDFARLIH